MPEKAFHKALRHLHETALGTLWRQWAALGALTAGGKHARGIVDPEGLVLLSLSLAEEEHRLWDLLNWWARVGATLISVQRIRNLAGRYPDQVRGRLGEFAHLAHHEGGDFRWRPLERPVSKRVIRLGKNLGRQPQLLVSPALMLRLRLGLGVGIKADLLAFLLGIGGARVSVRTIAEALAYTPRAVHRAVDDMAGARLIQAIEGTPKLYHVDPKPWIELLGTSRGAPPTWCEWPPVFAFVAALGEWAEGQNLLKASPYVLSSQARDLMERHRIAFTRNQISIPYPDDYSGEAYIQGFEKTLTTLASWMEENA